MLTCEEFAEQVSQYLDGELNLGERASMRMHQLICRHCRRYLKQTRLVIHLMGQPSTTLRPDDRLEGHLVDAIIAQLGEASGEET